MADKNSQWFTSWFNTPYYHMLYQDRNHQEAESFMQNLTRYLNLEDNATILDLACGKGRHAVYLSSLGYSVTGLDLSSESIAYAKQLENEHLFFDLHDMSLPYSKKFNAVFNLFTSFGYFEDDEDNLKTLKAIKSNLKPNGIAVIDFMNVDYVLDNLINENTKERQSIVFTEKRKYENGYIIKDINFDDEGKSYHYQERVKAFRLQDFQKLFNEASLSLIEIFGDYKLGKYLPHKSERLIMVLM